MPLVRYSPAAPVKRIVSKKSGGPPGKGGPAAQNR